VAKKSVAYRSGPTHGIVARLLLVALAAGALYLTYEFGRLRAGYHVIEAMGERGEFEDRIAALEKEKLALSEQIA
jgi:hypothetical protein